MRMLERYGSWTFLPLNWGRSNCCSLIAKKLLMAGKQEKEMLFLSYTVVNAQGERIAPSKSMSSLMFKQARGRKAMKKEWHSQVFSNKKYLILLFPFYCLGGSELNGNARQSKARGPPTIIQCYPRGLHAFLVCWGFCCLSDNFLTCTYNLKWYPLTRMFFSLEKIWTG